MRFHPYTIVEKEMPMQDTVVVRVSPNNKSGVEYKPGQYCYIVNPLFPVPDESHPFSIASSPVNQDFLEFCIKVAGDWTNDFMELPRGSALHISEAVGEFMWDSSHSYAVFLVGGIGISPLMSMIRTNIHAKNPSTIKLLYGNRTPDTIMYGAELAAYEKKYPWLSVTHVFSHIEPAYPWGGHRGFITGDILQEEVHFDLNPVFYMVGPSVFTEKMTRLLQDFRVDPSLIRQEMLA